MKTPSTLLLLASPRKGNSFSAMEIFTQVFKNEGVSFQTVSLTDKSILPCIACEACAHAVRKSKIKDIKSLIHSCPLQTKDSSAELLYALAKAHSLIVFSPIYHYHLPAQLKAVLDRLQPFYEASVVHSPLMHPESQQEKPLLPVLIAGRPHGELLFKGSLLSLKYAFLPLRYTVAHPLTLRGLDLAKSLTVSSEYRGLVEEKARETATLLKELPRA